MNEQLSFKLERIPHKPGVYLWKDKYGNIIYVGKAKDLFKRTHQYFLHAQNDKTSLLVENIVDVDVIIVKNENESLILESNLIKKHKPRFNILLKDGGNYPYILLTKEEHPRLLYTRDFKKNKGTYYGPFATSKSNRYDLYSLLLKLYPFRKCSYIPKSKCLYYDIDQCLGPCINKIEHGQYLPYIHSIDQFFKGKPNLIIDELKNKELKASEQLNFELAQNYLNLIKQLKETSKEISGEQVINLNARENIDVIGYHIKNNLLAIVIFSYVNGKLLTKHQQIVDIYADQVDAISDYVIEFYRDTYNLPKKCFINLDKGELKNISNIIHLEFINPKSGRYKNVLQIAATNAKNFINSNYLIHQQQIKRNFGSFEELKKMLSIDNLSLIHVFDMSNLFGNDKIGAMISLENGVFNKNGYRKFIIKDLQTNSDFAYMKETILRQYKKMIDEEQMLPNLIIVDGGIIQINATIQSLTELNLNKVIPVIGLSKDDRHKTNSIVFPNKKQIVLDRQSNLYFYLSNIQEEIHRYAITFFRKRNVNSLFKSTLNDIEGLGKVSIDKILSHYDNVANLAKSNVDELKQFVNKKVAIRILEKLKNFKN